MRRPSGPDPPHGPDPAGAVPAGRRPRARHAPPARARAHPRRPPRPGRRRDRAIFLSRYAAADLAVADARGRALGTVLFATALGTVAGPALLVPTGRLAQALGLPRVAGLYLVSVAAFAAAGLAGAGPAA